MEIRFDHVGPHLLRIAPPSLDGEAGPNGAGAERSGRLSQGHCALVKSQAEKYFNAVRFNEFPRGGHFAIHEQAPVLARNIREFFRPLRETPQPYKET